MNKSTALITMAQGNPKALRRTFESYRPYCDEIVFGDVLLFEEDRAAVKAMEAEFKLRVVRFDFDFIFHNGFSAILNRLASQATTELALYANCGEIIDPNYPVNWPQQDDGHNCYFFKHATETHHWIRTYDPKQLEWSGLIHEEVCGLFPRNCRPTEVFYMADTEKDTDDPFRRRVCEDVKEMVYFEQLDRLRRQPHLLGGTNAGWLDYTNKQGLYYVTQQLKRGLRYIAFHQHCFELYMQQAKHDFA